VAVAGPDDGGMVWVILAAIGVPLWLCAVAIVTLVVRNRKLRRRADNIPVRFRAARDKRWTRGHGLWTHDVLAFRGSPAAWNEGLMWVTGVSLRDADEEERAKLHGLADRPVIARLELHGGATVEAAAAGERRDMLAGPCAARPVGSPTSSATAVAG
jgi:hypothetical protein